MNEPKFLNIGLLLGFIRLFLFSVKTRGPNCTKNWAQFIEILYKKFYSGMQFKSLKKDDACDMELASESPKSNRYQIHFQTIEFYFVH